MKKLLFLFCLCCFTECLAQNPTESPKEQIRRILSLVQSDFHLLGDATEKANHPIYEKHLSNKLAPTATISNHFQENTEGKYQEGSWKDYVEKLKEFENGFRWNFIFDEKGIDEKKRIVRGVFQFQAHTKEKTYQNMDSFYVHLRKENQEFIIDTIRIFKIKAFNPFEQAQLKLYQDSLANCLKNLGNKDEKIRKNAQNTLKSLFHDKGKILIKGKKDEYEVVQYIAFFDNSTENQAKQERNVVGYTLCYLENFYQDVDNNFYARTKKYMFYDNKTQQQAGTLRVDYKAFQEKKTYYLFEQVILEVVNPTPPKNNKANTKNTNKPKPNNSPKKTG